MNTPISLLEYVPKVSSYVYLQIINCKKHRIIKEDMNNIEEKLKEMSLLVPEIRPFPESMKEIKREIQLELDDFNNSRFQGKHLKEIRFLIMEQYKEPIYCMYANFGWNVIKHMYDITIIMDRINRKFPGTFNVVPSIKQLNCMETTRSVENRIYRRAECFWRLANNPYIERNWDAILHIDVNDWGRLTNANGNEILSPMSLVNKSKYPQLEPSSEISRRYSN
jgi:hypothetical protein